MHTENDTPSTSFGIPPSAASTYQESVFFGRFPTVLFSEAGATFPARPGGYEKFHNFPARRRSKLTQRCVGRARRSRLNSFVHLCPGIFAPAELCGPPVIRSPFYLTRIRSEGKSALIVDF